MNINTNSIDPNNMLNNSLGTNMTRFRNLSEYETYTSKNLMFELEVSGGQMYELELNDGQ